MPFPSASLAVLLALGTLPQSAPGKAAQLLDCRPETVTSVDASAVMKRVVQAVGLDAAGGRMFHLRSRMIREFRDLSDRSYPPFDAGVSEEDLWFDPATGIERAPAPFSRQPSWSGARSTLVGAADSTGPASPALHGATRWQRAFNAWAVVFDWSNDARVTVAGRCRYRDEVRLVLHRPSSGGGESLLIDEVDWLPVALRRSEANFFFGPESVEYRYYNWDRIGPALFPQSTMRLVAGQKDRLRSLRQGPGETDLVSRDSAPRFPEITSTLEMGDTIRVPPQPFWSTAAPDTVRVGPHSFLLVNSSFTSAVALAADTVFILDSSQGEQRARQDSAWIGRLFPGHHPVVFVAQTDIWPHIAGLRFWVASGAGIIAHPTTMPLLKRAIARRWTAAPDLLERQRARVSPRFVTVSTSQSRAGGAVQIFAVGGSQSEGVLGVYVRDDRFLWASDRVQDVTNPSFYVTELVRAAQRVHIEPQWTSGPHLRLIGWDVVQRLGQR